MGQIRTKMHRNRGGSADHAFRIIVPLLSDACIFVALVGSPLPRHTPPAGKSAYFLTEVFFLSIVIGACPVTTDYIMAMASQCQAMSDPP